MRHRSTVLAAALALACTGLQAQSTQAADQPDAAALRETANALFGPVPHRIEQVRGQQVTAAQVELGKSLWFEPRLSRSHVISCNTCHNVATGGADNVPTSIGHGWQKGPRNSPTVLNAVLNIAQFWDGRAEDLKEQAKGPVQASVEMNNTPERVEATLRSIPAYVEAFRKAFPGEREPVTFENMARALEAFETTLVTPDSRFDQFLAGKDSLDATELRGLSLFIDKGCASCHSGPNVGGQAYFPFGVVARPGADVLPAGDKGRFAVTQTASDEYVFRAAPLRNVELTAPYFHSGQVWDLHQAVAIMGSSQLGHELDAAEVEAIARFLKTLTGRQPQVTTPLLPPSTSTTPRPE
ncbi:cytochrome-c peroxidase [Pseudoxanthomonas sp. SGNA-20]|jgi:Cytochrome c peroxidase|uniref:Cytochrome c peroxidase n=1 Tax=Pseudoxanthomonas taiwanensis J19 TaxID=935569 RepID=A0A562DIR5_9GAMM|nr:MULTISPECIES: cytochrome-c peroxidase [Pseudoxanthomonas]RRN58512.1 cytochrome-c peroxidase [Pseudoxanthomonas sp. SGNA-20]TWH09495.1 cytochrome c peroxidase [Pseudoxanthomonas taiwanensis J19]